MTCLLPRSQSSANAIHREVQNAEIGRMGEEASSEEPCARTPNRQSVSLCVGHVKAHDLLPNRSLPRGTFQQGKIKPSANNKKTKNQQHSGLAKRRDNGAWRLVRMEFQERQRDSLCYREERNKHGHRDGQDNEVQNCRRHPKPKTGVARIGASGHGWVLSVRLLLNGQRWTADVLLLEVETDVDMVRNLDERNSFVHPIVLTVKNHCSLDLARARPFTGNGQRELLRIRYSADCEVTIDLVRVVTGLHNFRGLERNHRVLLDIKKILALQLSILQTAAGIGRYPPEL